jgi:hypothetical protein
MVDRSQILGYYTRPATMTDAGDCASSFEGMPDDVGGLASVLHGLLIHEHWAPTYGVTLSDERRAEVHVRRAADRLAAVRARDPRPLDATREPAERIVSNCRHYTVLMTSMLRARGIPARGRCGFGMYFEQGKGVDHWVCEYWDAARDRWVMVDAQIDGVQGGWLKPDFDVLDVPRDRFLIAGDAWLQCRSGAADADAFGIMDMHGFWFIAGNLLRDLAALNNMEMLPWDDWGAMVGPEQEIDQDRLALFDRVAALTRDPDRHFDELRALYEADERLRVPATVFNAIRQRSEPV